LLLEKGERKRKKETVLKNGKISILIVIKGRNNKAMKVPLWIHFEKVEVEGRHRPA
jgi:hypothetical protein